MDSTGQFQYGPHDFNVESAAWTRGGIDGGANHHLLGRNLVCFGYFDAVEAIHFKCLCSSIAVNPRFAVH